MRRGMILMLLATLLLVLAPAESNAAISAQAADAKPASFFPTNFPDPTGVTDLTGEQQISTPTTPECERYRPAVAYNYRHREYLVVWHNTWPSGNRDIYGQRIAHDGQLIGSWFAITAGSYSRSQPALAYNATNDEYLVTWTYDVAGDGSHQEIWGRIIAWNNSYQQVEQAIGNWAVPYDHWSSSVAWNALHNEYLVIWDTLHTGLNEAVGIGARRVGSAGVPQALVMPITGDLPHQSDLVYNVAGDRYLAVWTRFASGTGFDIYGAFLDREGAVRPSPGDFLIAGGAASERNPAVATDEQAQFMVVWERFDSSYSPGDWDVYARLLDMAGNLTSEKLSLAATLDHETAPAIFGNGGSKQFLVAWQREASAGQQIVARLRRANGAFLPVVPVADWAFWDNESPAVAAGEAGFVTVYAGDSSVTARHIYGRVYWPQVVYLPSIYAR